VVDGGASALLVFLFGHPDRSAFLRARLHARAGERGLLPPLGLEVLAKTEACAFGIAAIAWFVARARNIRPTT
jgi:hypothetical protein